MLIAEIAQWSYKKNAKTSYKTNNIQRLFIFSGFVRFVGPYGCSEIAIFIDRILNRISRAFLPVTGRIELL